MCGNGWRNLMIEITEVVQEHGGGQDLTTDSMEFNLVIHNCDDAP